MTEQRISHYEVKKVLGEGAMGRVYLAEDLNLHRPVALKMLGERTFGDPSFLERFRREARLAAQLNHPHIATIYEFGEDDGKAFIAMEFVEGQTLAEMIAEGPLPLARVKKYGRQAASALADAHDLGIIHRDIKPANLMVTGRDDLKVMDFGVARRSGDTQLTMAGSLIGTANIMAPEMIQGKEPGTQVDLFSLGCVLYEALAGRPAFVGDDAMAVLYQVTNQDPTPLETFRSDVPAAVIDLVNALLIKDPEHRFGPASAVAAALADDPGTSADATMQFTAQQTAILNDPQATAAFSTGAISGTQAGGGAGTAAGTQTETQAAPASKKKWWLLGGGGLIGVISVVAVLLLGRGGDANPELARTLVVQGEELVKGFAQNVGGPTAEDAAEVIGLFSQAIEADPSNAAAWNNRAEQYRLQGDLVRAEAEFKKAIEADPAFAVPWNNLAEISRGRGDRTRAETQLRTAIRLDPAYGAAHVNLATLLESAGRLDEAEEEYRLAMLDERAKLVAVNNLAFLWVTHGRPAAADSLLTPALLEFPRVAALWKNSGLALFQSGRFTDADSAFAHALHLSPKYPAALAGRARVADRAGNAPLARTWWAQVVAAGPDSALAAEARAALTPDP